MQHFVQPRQGLIQRRQPHQLRQQVGLLRPQFIRAHRDRADILVQLRAQPFQRVLHGFPGKRALPGVAHRHIIRRQMGQRRKARAQINQSGHRNAGTGIGGKGGKMRAPVEGRHKATRRIRIARRPQDITGDDARGAHPVIPGQMAAGKANLHALFDGDGGGGDRNTVGVGGMRMIPARQHHRRVHRPQRGSDGGRKGNHAIRSNRDSAQNTRQIGCMGIGPFQLDRVAGLDAAQIIGRCANQNSPAALRHHPRAHILT